MKSDIHPEYTEKTVICSCSNTFLTRSTTKSDTMRIDVCNACHPFYTGTQKILDTAGRIDKFWERYGKPKNQAAEKSN